ncbi:LytTR family DNA-binding domain-containing protein [uncultured Tenacibaculum sp.]|uniref:LytR/AlgR family response regulator transcription factor n=1 Tax=uncultured Tenacibaculum sp. TaxID=174713 RepID=UPI0026076BA2|nr:LytTR family DNA-binding domain-containing protein [uncultured Tenacibaculum sp.]
MKILIIEDEARIAKRIERMTKEFFLNTLQELTCVHSLAEGIEYIQNNKLDLLLLDLNLNGESGFEVLQNSVSEAFHTIIISANKHQALTAFEHGVLDFVPKPFNKNRLEQAFNRIIKKEEVTTENLQYLAIKKRTGVQLIDIKNVRYIKGAGVYTEVFLTNEQKELHDKSLEKLSQLLPESFQRIHKSYLVKITEIKEIIVQTGSKYSIELNNGEILPVGRTKYKELKKLFF